MDSIEIATRANQPIIPVCRRLATQVPQWLALPSDAMMEKLVGALHGAGQGAYYGGISGSVGGYSNGFFVRGEARLPDSCELGNSFTPDTHVLMADGSTKAISEVEIGDWVLAEDPETGVSGSRQVTHLITGQGEKELVDIVIDGETITATDQHPFWVESRGQWVDAEDLRAGDLLQNDAGVTVAIDSVDEYTVSFQTVHNLTVDDIHTYYVVSGGESVLVHNCSHSISNKQFELVDPTGNAAILGGARLARHIIDDYLPGSVFVGGFNSSNKSILAIPSVELDFRSATLEQVGSLPRTASGEMPYRGFSGGRNIYFDEFGRAVRGSSHGSVNARMAKLGFGLADVGFSFKIQHDGRLAVNFKSIRINKPVHGDIVASLASQREVIELLTQLTGRDAISIGGKSLDNL